MADNNVTMSPIALDIVAHYIADDRRENIVLRNNMYTGLMRLKQMSGQAIASCTQRQLANGTIIYFIFQQDVTFLF